MTEYTIAVEGELTVDGRLVRSDALTWETPMPVYGVRAEGEWSSPIVGTIKDIRRIYGEGDRNLLEANISWFGEVPTGTGLCAQVDAVESDYEDTDNQVLILKNARLRAAFLGEPAWPDCMIHTEENGDSRG